MDKEILEGLSDFGQVSAVGAALSGRAEDYVNDPTLEMAWAEMAFRHSETYFKLLTAIECTKLRLTPRDDEILEHFHRAFPKLHVDKLDEAALKADLSKTKWREFCNTYEGVVEDFNFGTLLRLDAAGEYSSENTTLVPRVQFLAIEIARNRAGLNAVHHRPAVKQHHKHPAPAAAAAAAPAPASEGGAGAATGSS